MPTSPSLTDRLCRLARDAAAPRDPAAAPANDQDPDTALLSDRPDGTVVGCGDIVAKAHPAASEAELRALTVRLSIAAHPRLQGIMLAPLAPDGRPAEPTARIRPLLLDGPDGPDEGRPATLWPRGEPVDPDEPDSAPWAAAGTLLARLHSVPADALAAQLPGPLPEMRGPAKAARALERVRTAVADGTAAPGLASAAVAAEAAWATLPAWCRNEEPPAPSRAGTLCHGDFHLGQLVRHPGDGGSWQLIDVDDLGLGDPAWDLARPAAWFATGLLPAPSWETFLHAYQAGTGTEGVDPWPRLDAPARALTAQTTAIAVAKAHAAGRPLDEAETACAAACSRIAGTAPGQRRATGRTVELQQPSGD